MTKNLALAASVMMLVVISGQAFAETAAPNARYWPEATGPSDRQAVFVSFTLDVLFHQMPGEPSTRAPGLGAVCGGAVDAQRTIDG